MTHDVRDFVFALKYEDYSYYAVPVAFLILFTFILLSGFTVPYCT